MNRLPSSFRYLPFLLFRWHGYSLLCTGKDFIDSQEEETSVCVGVGVCTVWEKELGMKKKMTRQREACIPTLPTNRMQDVRHDRTSEQDYRQASRTGDMFDA
jgi:hypothetical protein